MNPDWLLVETLGTEPAVVAQGQQTKNLVPISAFLRRNPNLMAIRTAISETVRAGQALSSITPKNDRVIRTEVVQMTDGRIHGVHVWVGPPDVEPPQRRIPGPLKWDLTNGIATDTTESLFNSGLRPDGRGHPRPRVRRGSAHPRSQPERGRGAGGGDQARAGPHLLQHLGRHRPRRQPDHRRVRRAHHGRERRRRPRAVDLPGDELAQCA